MTREQMCKVNFRAFMLVIYKEPRMECPAECMLVSINFDGELALLRPIPDSEYEPDDFWGNIKYLELPRPKPRLVKPTPVNEK